jgi:hypothetical protein
MRPMLSANRLGWALFFLPAGAVAVAACVGDAPVGQPDAAGADATTDTQADVSAPPDGSPPGDAGADVTVDAGPCSNPLVSAVIQLPTGGGAAPFIPGSGPLIAGDYTLTFLQLDCNGACGAPAGSILGGVRVSSSGPGQVTIERRIEMQQDDAGTTKAIDKWSGSFDQLNRQFQLGEDCPGSDPDAGWGGGFPTNFQDGGPTDQLKFRFPDIKILTSQGMSTALMTFTKQ